MGKRRNCFVTRLVCLGLSSCCGRRRRPKCLLAMRGEVILEDLNVGRVICDSRERMIAEQVDDAEAAPNHDFLSVLRDSLDLASWFLSPSTNRVSEESVGGLVGECRSAPVVVLVSNCSLDARIFVLLCQRWRRVGQSTLGAHPFELALYRPSGHVPTSVPKQRLRQFFRLVVLSNPLAEYLVGGGGDRAGSATTASVLHRAVFFDLGNIALDSSNGDLRQTNSRGKRSMAVVPEPLPLPVSDASVPRDKCHRYCLTSLQHPKQRCIGFARRRVGRGGRVHLDRAYTSLDEYWADLGFSICDNSKNGFISNEFLQEIRNEWLHFKPEKQSASRSPSPGGDSLEPNFVIPCDVTCTDSDLFTEPLHMDLTVLPLSLSCGPVLCDADDGADQDKEKAEGEEERKGSGGLRDGGKLPEVERQPTLNGPATVDMTESSSYSIPVVTPQLPDVILSHSVPSSKPLASITARLPDCKPLAFIPSDQKLVKRTWISWAGARVV
ncbi:unnamed protein product [Darwinula stevensoni]|uniref:Uncharacterized protein n=1 Tax=Darwinula stevensoni TaxID=69355 RepID=A0A7R8XDX1_9CRUS|nr:unnamed protein product [Darwinula stevensoni]CAG0889008.1 unnamed protein product [Darwinula stevensoni]